MTYATISRRARARLSAAAGLSLAVLVPSALFIYAFCVATN